MKWRLSVMTTARSSFSFSRVLPFYRNMLRRHRGSALFYGALGFLFLPVQYLLALRFTAGAVLLGLPLWYAADAPQQRAP